MVKPPPVRYKSGATSAKCGTKFKNLRGAMVTCDMPKGHLGPHIAKKAPNRNTRRR